MPRLFRIGFRIPPAATTSTLSTTTIAEVVERINGHNRNQRGRVKVGGVLWFAVSSNGQSIEVGQIGRVVARDGVYLKVEEL